jgi:transcriptional regulator of met regulon
MPFVVVIVATDAGRDGKSDDASGLLAQLHGESSELLCRNLLYAYTDKCVLQDVLDKLHHLSVLD